MTLTEKQRFDLFSSLVPYVIRHHDDQNSITEFYNNWEKESGHQIRNHELLAFVLEWMSRARDMNPDLMRELARLDGFDVEGKVAVDGAIVSD